MSWLPAEKAIGAGYMAEVIWTALRRSSWLLLGSSFQFPAAAQVVNGNMFAEFVFKGHDILLVC